MTVVEIDLAPGAERVAVVTVNDPERRNALTPPMDGPEARLWRSRRALRRCKIKLAPWTRRLNARV